MELDGSVLVTRSVIEEKKQNETARDCRPEPLKIQRFNMSLKTLNVSIRQILRFLIKLVVAIVLLLYQLARKAPSFMTVI